MNVGVRLSGEAEGYASDMSPVAHRGTAGHRSGADVGGMTERSPRQLPAVWLVVACFGLSLTLGLVVAHAVVSALAAGVGAAAALPAGLMSFIVVSAVALVLTARLDAARRQPTR